MNGDHTPPVKPDATYLQAALNCLSAHLGDFQTPPSGPPRSPRVQFAIQLIRDELEGKALEVPRDRAAGTARFCLSAAQHGLRSLAELSKTQHERDHTAAALELVDAALQTMGQSEAAMWPSLDSEKGRKRCMRFGGYEIARQALLEFDEQGAAGAKRYLEYIQEKGARG